MLQVSDFPHSKIIAKAKISLTDLSDDLRSVITTFTQKYNGYKLHPNDANEKQLMSLSNIISQNIYDYYIDRDDQEVEIEKNETISSSEVNKIASEIKEEVKEEKKEEPAPIAPVATAVAGSTQTGNTAQATVIPIPPPVVVPDPATEKEPENKNEKVLYHLLKENITSSITKSLLRSKGFDIDKVSIRGCRVGKYLLYKEFSEDTYNLKLA